MSVRHNHTRLRIPDADADAPVPPDLLDYIATAADAGWELAQKHLVSRAFSDVEPRTVREALQPWIAASRES